MKLKSDVVVVGGGPVGSTLAAFLLQRGNSVTIVEELNFPRYQIGESLVPQVLDVLEESGALPAVESAGFLRKEGGIFRWGKKQEPWSFYFDEAFQRYKHQYAYQVTRADFDKILLDHAENCGANIIHARATDISVKENVLGSSAVVSARLRDGKDLKLEARISVDCSGQKGWLAHRFGLREHDTLLRNIALFSYFEGAKRLKGRDSNGIFCEAVENGWFWNIPLHDDTNSVGFVTKIPMKEDRQTVYDEAIESSQYIRNFLANARRVREVMAIPDYSYSSSQIVGPGFMLVGDAGNFIDPVWSTGVFLGTINAKMAARAIDFLISKDDTGSLMKYQEDTNRMYGTYRDFVHFFYTTQGNPEDYFWKAYQLVPHSVDPRDAFIQLVAGKAGHEF